jgi:hypothetical protein
MESFRYILGYFTTKEFIMSRVKFTLVAAVFTALALTFFACSSGGDDDDGGGGGSAVGTWSGQYTLNVEGGTVITYMTLELRAGGVAIATTTGTYISMGMEMPLETFEDIGSWSQSGNVLTLVTADGESDTVTISGNTISLPIYDEYDNVTGTMVLTKQNSSGGGRSSGGNQGGGGSSSSFSINTGAGTPGAADLQPYGLSQTQFNAIVNVIGTTSYGGYYIVNQGTTSILMIQWENKTTTDYNNLKEHFRTALGVNFSQEFTSDGVFYAMGNYGENVSIVTALNESDLIIQFMLQ